MEKKTLIIEQQSPFDVPTTVELIIAAAAEKQWQNPATHDLQQSLAKSRKVVRPVQVIEICKPEYSGRMLEKNHERIASIMMPCRISVYEKEDGKAYVTLLNMEAMADGLPSTVTEAIRGASEESLEIVSSVISKA
jgi:uncharacterized protein (DUF302 family)